MSPASPRFIEYLSLRMAHEMVTVSLTRCYAHLSPAWSPCRLLYMLWSVVCVWWLWCVRISRMVFSASILRGRSLLLRYPDSHSDWLCKVKD